MTASKLTPREKEVVVLIGRGLSMAEISAALKIEVSTARKHRENAMRKLDLHSTAELVLYVVRRRLDKDQ